MKPKYGSEKQGTVPAKEAVRPTAGRGFLKGLACGLTPLFALLVMAAALPSGKTSDDALFIDPQGRIGIGTAQPEAALDVRGNVAVSGRIAIGTANPGNSRLAIQEADSRPGHGLQVINAKGDKSAGFWVGETSGALEGNDATDLLFRTGGQNRMRITNEGSVGVGTNEPRAKLDIQNAERTGSHPASVNGLYVTGDFGADNNGVEFRHSNATQGIGIGYNTIYAAGSHADQDLNIKPKGSGQVAVKGNLDVDGTVNGERRRDRFQVGDPDEQTQWLDRVVDIKEICGDEDGCRIKLLMQHELNDTVRTITEEIYIEQTKISKNRLPGLYGHTRQSGGGEYNDWRLGVGADNRYTLFSPYNWIYGLNYRHKYVIKGSHGPAFTGEETYKIAIMVHPHVTATVIIYDR